MKTLNSSHMTHTCIIVVACLAVLFLLPSCSKSNFPFGQKKPETKQDSKASVSSGKKAKAVKIPDVAQKKATFLIHETTG
jgi:hypothetical protein